MGEAEWMGVECEAVDLMVRFIPVGYLQPVLQGDIGDSVQDSRVSFSAARSERSSLHEPNPLLDLQYSYLTVK